MNREVIDMKRWKFLSKMANGFMIQTAVMFIAAFLLGCAQDEERRESTCPSVNTACSAKRIKLDIKILSAKRTGRGGHNIEFTASFHNKDDKILILDRTGLSLGIKEMSKEDKTCFVQYARATTFKTIRYSPIERTPFYGKNNRYFEIAPNSSEELTFKTAYIGDQNIYERLYYGWADDTRHTWQEGSLGSDLVLTLDYSVPFETFHDDFLRNISVFDYETVYSPEFCVKLPSISDTDPPIFLSLISAHMKTLPEAKEGKDRVEYSVRVESTSTNAILLDIKHFVLSVSWFDEDSLLPLSSFGMKVIPSRDTLKILEQGRYLHIPSRAVRIITLTTGVMGEGNLPDLYSEIRKPEREESGYKNVSKWNWNNRVAEKYSVSVSYYLPNAAGPPNLLVNSDSKDKLIRRISSETRETDLGQTRFVGEAWLESPHEAKPSATYGQR